MDPARIREWQHLAIMGFLALWCLLFFWPVFTPNLEDRLYFPQGDFSDQFYLFTSFAAQSIKEGQLPLWNPYLLSGHPFLADVQSAVFYPLRLLTLFLIGPGRFPFLALESEAVFHFFLASLFTYFFVFRILHSKIPALISAMVFAYGGYLTSYPPLQLAILEVGVWLPLILLVLDWAWQRFEVARVRFPFAIAGIIFGISILAGHPQSSMYVFYAGLLYFLFRGYKHSPWRNSLILLAIFIGVGFGLAAAQIIPSMEYLTLSTRTQTTFEQVAQGFPPRDFIQLFLPGTMTVWSPMYVGILPLLLGVWGVVHRPKSWPLFWAGLAIISLLLSLGENFFLYRVFYAAVPGFSLFRGQERIVFLFSFSLAVLAGYGVASLASPKNDLGESAPKEIFFRLSLLATAGAVLMAGVLFYSWSQVFLLLFLAASTVLAWAHSRSLLPGNSFQVFALALVLLDLFLINGGNNLQPKNPENQYRPRAWMEPILAEGGLFRVDNWAERAQNYGIAYAIQEVRGASPFRLRRYRDLFTLPREKIWQLLGVKYVRARNSTLSVASEIVHHESRPIAEFYLHRLISPVPRAYIVYNVAVMGDRETLQALANPEWDIRETVILSEEPSFPIAHTSVAGHAATVTVYEPTRMVMEVEAQAEGFLVLSEIFYPGWRAAVDGAETKIYRANYTLRAIPLTPGHHRIEVVYDPLSAKIGITVSLLTLATVLVIGIASRWRNRFFLRSEALKN